MESQTLTQHICIAILPLRVMSADSRVEMFCQGLVMDLITDLSRFRSFQLIAYETTQGLHPNEEAGSASLDSLQLDYLVKGMVRQQGGQLLLNLQLIQVPQNRLVWAEKFSGNLEDLFQIQEDITEKIVVSLQHFVDYDLLSEIRKKSVTHLSAYECWLRGYQELKKGTVEADEQARTYFAQAMAIDPHYPRAYSGMSLSFFNEWSCQLWSRWEVSQTGAIEWAQKALELDEWDHVSNAILGRIYVFNAQYEKAEYYLRKSLHINPSDTETLIPIAVGLAYLGYLGEAQQLYERAQRLNPAHNFASCGAFIYFEQGKFEEALALADRHEVGKGWIDFPAFQAAACYLQGDLARMKQHWEAFVREFSKKINGGKPADSQEALEWMINVNPYRQDTRLKPFWEYMAGHSLDAPAPIIPSLPAVTQGQFLLEGSNWLLSYEGIQARLPDLKGCHDLARLLSQPRQPIHCTDLMGAQALEKGEQVFDEKARAAYKRRLQELQDEIAEADALQQSSRLVSLHEEYDQLLEHLSQALGKGGKTRKVGATIEKCRTAVTWRIRNAIRKISEIHPPLGRHLEISVQTGVFCEYAPEHDVRWLT